MDQIVSFAIDHTKLQPGLYLYGQDRDIVTFDLRFKKPNSGDLLTNSELHSTEHLVATLLRSSPVGDAVVFFGPMGCQTGFYFLFDARRLSVVDAVALLKEVFAQAAAFEGELPGKSAVECGNYKNLDTAAARAVCAAYAALIADWTVEQLAY